MSFLVSWKVKLRAIEFGRFVWHDKSEDWGLKRWLVWYARVEECIGGVVQRRGTVSPRERERVMVRWGEVRQQQRLHTPGSRSTLFIPSQSMAKWSEVMWCGHWPSNQGRHSRITSARARARASFTQLEQNKHVNMQDAQICQTSCKVNVHVMCHSAQERSNHATSQLYT